jgi:hypothetical protein
MIAHQRTAASSWDSESCGGNARVEILATSAVSGVLKPRHSVYSRAVAGSEGSMSF